MKSWVSGVSLSTYLEMTDGFYKTETLDAKQVISTQNTLAQFFFDVMQVCVMKVNTLSSECVCFCQLWWFREHVGHYM